MMAQNNARTGYPLGETSTEKYIIKEIKMTINNFAIIFNSFINYPSF